MDDAIAKFSQVTSDACYGALALVALWGMYCVIVVWRRAAQIRFRNDQVQAEFLTQVETDLAAGDFAAAAEKCRHDPRAVPELVLVAIDNRELGYSRVRHMVSDLFQREVMANLQHHISWIYTVIKTGPMLGLFGTVLGMMAAFGKLSGGQGDKKVEPAALAGDISFALITTALGLMIAIPLTLCVASINIRLRKIEDQAALGLTRFLDALKAAMTNSGKHG